MTQVDRDHPIFLPFADGDGRGLGAPRFFAYRDFSSPMASQGTEDRAPVDVRVRFDDGTPALVEGMAGRGRILLWNGSWSPVWTDLPLHGVFVPLAQEMTRYAAGRRDQLPARVVGQPVEARTLLEWVDPEGEASEATGLLVGPQGRGVPLTLAGGVPPVPEVPGFYELRMDDGGEGAVFAVNPDPAEMDLARVDSEEVALAVTSGSGGGASDPGGDPLVAGVGGLGDGPGASRAERERRQGAWRFLLAGVFLLLVGETLLAGRRTERPGARRMVRS